MTELLPAPNSVSSRAATAADSEFGVEPAARPTGRDEAWVARNGAGDRDDDGDEGDGTAEAVDERSPAAEHRSSSRDGGVRTDEDRE